MKHDLTELTNLNCDLEFYQDELYREYQCQSLDDLIARMSDKIEELQGELRDMSDAEESARNEVDIVKDELADAMNTINQLEAETQELTQIKRLLKRT